MPLVQVQNVTKTYKTGDSSVAALRGVSLEIEAGEFVAIMGPSGSGKSTFMNILGCIDRPTSGEYRLEGTPVQSLSDRQLSEIRSRKLGFVFQTFNLLPRASAARNVELPLIYAGATHAKEQARAALESMGLGDRLHHRPSQLSGGQQQRVAIARALVNDPILILADEPTGNLDSATAEEIMSIFQEINRRGKAIVLVTHEEDIARHCRRIIRFRDGTVVSDEQR